MMYVKRKTFTPKLCDKSEILRYAKCKDDNDSVNTLLTQCIDEAQNCLSFNVCYAEVPVKVENDLCDFGFASVKSLSLAKRLENCNNAVFFAATLGLELDRLIAKYSSVAPSKAVMLHAVGNERIEALCDCFCDFLKQEKEANAQITTTRFSAGYGDLSLDFQKDIFSLLNPQKYIGVTLNDSLLMSPSKSVTAIVGIKRV